MEPPLRIVSLVPSLTELIVWLGAGDRLVGRTRFCTEPAGEVEKVPVIGGTKNPRLQRIVSLNPDLVVANKEENRREDVEALRAAGLNVLLTDPNTLAEAISMVEHLGALLEMTEQAEALARDARAAIVPSTGRRPRVFAAVWWNPLMGLGAGTYGHDLLHSAGADNVLAGRVRYPEVSLDDVAALRPDLVLLPDEPFPFKPAHVADFASVAPARVIDGKLLWWYGPRMPSAIRRLHELITEVSTPT